MLNQYLKQVQVGEVQSPVEITFKNLERNEKQRRDHDSDLVANLKHVLESRDLDKDQRKALLQAQEHKEFVIDPVILDPLISNYEKSNKTLNLENMTLRSDTTRLCDAMDMLVKDNIKLREFINKKNNDMGKVLNTLAEEEGEIVSSLKDNISVIEEENQHLLYKVEQLEELLERERDLTRGLEQGMQGGKQMSKRIAEDLNEVRLRDKASTEKLMIMSTQLKNSQDLLEKETIDKEKILRELDALKKKMNDKERDSLNLSTQIAREFDLAGKKGQLDRETEVNDMLQDNLLLKEEVQYLKEQLRLHQTDKNEANSKQTLENFRQSINRSFNQEYHELDVIGNHMMRVSQVQDEKPSTVELNAKLNQLNKENQDLALMLQNTEKKYKLLQNLQQDSQIREINSNRSPIEMVTNESAKLRSDLMIKKNELETEKKQNAQFLRLQI